MNIFCDIVDMNKVKIVKRVMFRSVNIRYDYQYDCIAGVKSWYKFDPKEIKFHLYEKGGHEIIMPRSKEYIEKLNKEIRLITGLIHVLSSLICDYLSIHHSP